VTIHVSALAVEDTMELARHAQRIGADGILAITPYFWTPSLAAIHAHFVRLCSSIELPVLSYNSPSYLAGVEITGDLMSRLIEQLPNFLGVKEASFNSEKFLEISRAALSMRPDFVMLTGVEYLLPSVPLGDRLLFGGGVDLSQSMLTAVRCLHRRRLAACARAAIQNLVALAPVPRPIPLLAQRRHGDDGTPGRTDASTVADRHQGAPGLRPQRAGAARHPRHRAARLVILL